MKTDKLRLKKQRKMWQTETCIAVIYSPVIYDGLRQQELQFGRVVNIAIQVSLSLVSAIHLEYRRKYCQYFLQQVSLAVSPILFQPKLRY